MLLVIPPAARPESIRVAGQEVPAPAGRRAQTLPIPEGFRLVTLLAPPAAGVEVEVVLGALGHEEWTLVDRSPGLPPAGAALLSARPADAAQVQDGDMTIVTHKVRV
jgi:hypothetical protein